MLQVIQKWQVTVKLSNGKQTQVWISGQFVGNVMRALADMSFDANPLVSVERITIEQQMPAGAVQSGVSVGGYVRTEPPNQ